MDTQTPIKVEVDNLQVLTALRKAKQITPERVKGIMFTAGLMVAEDTDVPVDEGDLKTTMKVGQRLTGAYVKLGSKNAFHGTFIHYGVPRYGIEPRPVIVEALNRQKPRIVSHFEREIGQVLREAGL